MVFVSGGHGRTLVQVDRHGRRAPLTDDRRGFRMPSVSPNGRHVAVTIDPRPSQLWVYDLVRRSGTPLSTEGHHVAKVWTPDAPHVVYSNNGDMHRKAADGSGAAQRLLERELPQYPQAWSKDGKLLIFTDDHPTNGSDIWVLPEGGEPRSLITAHGDQQQARLSPDGRLLAYMSNETGRFEVHVRPFPNVQAAQWIVSTAGGGYPAWSPSGRELFYMDGTTMMSVSVESGRDTFTAGVPEPLFSGPFHTGSPEFDITPNGTFVMVEADPDARPTQIHLVQNWHEELKRIVPTR
jgi:eukaryotic-like serine/threonine-protein kinase